jgi:hypothetical protein
MLLYDGSQRSGRKPVELRRPDVGDGTAAQANAPVFNERIDLVIEGVDVPRPNIPWR